MKWVSEFTYLTWEQLFYRLAVLAPMGALSVLILLRMRNSVHATILPTLKAGKRVCKVHEFQLSGEHPPCFVKRGIWWNSPATATKTFIQYTVVITTSSVQETCFGISDDLIKTVFICFISIAVGTTKRFG